MSGHRLVSTLPALGRSIVLASAIFASGCVVSTPGVTVALTPPVVVAAHQVRTGWVYVQVGRTWYYVPKGNHRHGHPRHGYYVHRRGVWVWVP